jgi:signal transduction histidine kinase
MNAADRSELVQVLQERCDTIADSWYQAIARTSWVPHSTAEVRQHLGELTEQAIALLLTDPLEHGRAEAIGASLARLHYLEPEALGRTQELLAQQLVEGMPADQVVALQPRLAALLGGLAAGFFQQAREAILAEQEQIRGAVISELQRTEGALQKAYDEVERRVRERTAELAVVNEKLWQEIVERKQAEETLRKAHEELERRVEERTSELTTANEQLKREIEERQRAEEELWQHTERLRVLHEIDHGILAARSPEAIAQTVLHHVQRLVPCLGAGVMVLDFEAGGAIALVAEVNGELVVQTGTRLSLEEFEGAEELIESLRQGKVHAVEDILAIPQPPPVLQTLRAEGLRSLLNVPLVAEDELIGFLSLRAGSPGPFAPEHVDIAREVAGPLAIAIQQARLFDLVRAGRERLRRLAQQIISTQEEERQRLSRALHDEAGQALIALKISLQLIQEDLPVDFGLLRQRIGDAAALTTTTMEQIRLLAQNLRPPALDTVGLGPTLEGFCRDFAQRTQLSIDYLGMELPVIPEAVNICLYRFLQEALTNVAKHACADQVHVVLHCDAETISLSVEDDGRGFDKLARLSLSGWPMGIGLLGMQERLESLGGRLEIESQPGHGTRLVAYLPTGDIP